MRLARGGVFPGDNAGASLKLDNAAPAPDRAGVFPGDNAGASLKPRVRVMSRGRMQGLPR